MMWFVLAAAFFAHPAAQAQGPALHSVSSHHSAGAAAQPDDGTAQAEEQADIVANSREAGLLTDWHLMGNYGHGSPADFPRRFAPERWAANWAANQAANQAANEAADHQSAPALERRPKSPRYELVFPEGTFVLPPKLAARKGVFYALSCVYLNGGGEWNVYLESDARANVFVDGKLVLTRDPGATGTLRETIHAESGFHLVMVKFVAQAAPFRVAILPPNSNSRRKNNTPYLPRSTAPEDLQAALRGTLSIGDAQRR